MRSTRTIAPTLAVIALIAAGCGTTSQPDAQERSTTSSTTSAVRSGDDAPTSGGARVDAASTCPAEPTEAQAEGPYFTPDAPAKADLSRDVDDPAQVIDIAGTVYDPGCDPVAGVRVDVWQSDGAGEYDNEGYRLRGHRTTDQRGRYQVRTIVPGEYSGRTEHIHVKLTDRSGAELLTTQLYVPGASKPDEDQAGLFHGTNLLEPVDLEATPPRYRFDLRVE